MFARILIFLLLLSLLPAQAADLQTYVIDSDASSIRVLVYRAGLLSGLGHNHIIASRDINGIVKCSTELQDTLVDIHFPVATLIVDDAELRDLEGDDFPGRLSEKDVQGTRRNMLGRKLLDADNYPEVRIRSINISGELESLTVVAEATVAGRTSSITFPASVSRTDERLLISGIVRVNHRDLGLKPFTAGFGTLRVHQEMTIRFELLAHRL